MNNRLYNREILKNTGFNLLKEGKTIRIKAHGYSMYPCIRPGSVILIEPIRIKGNPVPGEIIAIKRESGLIVHRLIKVIKKNSVDYYIARGDSNAWPDNPVEIDKIAGRIIRAEFSEQHVPADIKINERPSYFLNRIRVIFIILWNRIRRKL
ncbi:MAG TPA: S24/S26 family peptidase [Bacteroidales bacterium]|nr:S24/S26 family peptidase [Bacteroidales bacterium]